ncbi:S8 family serine peptidase [Streptomyces sp. NBC_01352]|uniref:S8 family serine peptidase n=1 Tax=unclassified Streptomyces TaxID=2593676 RepID=UPI002258DA62|nr:MULTISPECIES: S8 family serine peptidase [unclassified Streptomyces]MCX4706772.1 S8 family serine peptidase [Streptomyces sp. NBC_01373]
MAQITINGVSVDPLVQSAELASASLVSEDASHSNYLLVQTTHVPTAEEKGQLAALGVEIHEYVPESTYLCGYRPSDLEAVRTLPFVAWADVYLEGFKLGQSLRSSRLRPAIADLAEPLEAAAPGTHTVDVVLHPDVDAASDGVQERIAQAAGVSAGDVGSGHRKVRMTVQEAGLAALATLDEVHHVEGVPEMVLHNTTAGTLMHTRVSLNGTPFRGAGQVVAVADTGFDRGSTADVHPAFSGRVKRLVALGRTLSQRADDPDGHGTHVAGSVLGNGTSASMGGAVTGTAPEAELVLQSLLDENGNLGGIPPDLRDLFEPPFLQDGVRIHTNSWGPKRPSLPYDSSAFEADEMVWDHKDFVICFSAGNSGHDRDRDGQINKASVSGQAGAKNVITIGASESNRPDIPLTYGQLNIGSFPVNPIRDDRQANNPAGMAAFSSRGPTQEGRIKPDVVAPGTSILSAHSRVAGPDNLFGTSSDSDFFFLSGTSMATPLVAGCVAVLRETLVKNGTPNPSAALLKAMLINGAQDLPGQYNPSEAGASPNNNSGFGLVNLERSTALQSDGDRAGFADEEELDQGEERSFPVTVPQGADNTLKITLVWTDPPGAALQNDLDLIVRVGGQERHGNMGTNPGFDRVNNVEQVSWKGLPAGDAEVVVRAHRITQFAQPYALAWQFS